ncbi:MAG: hypothetical protein EAZ60_07600 [Oscillatoriales cyanobacterium]|nr:MAG: hypothetical protein EAZ83_31020 [Oscillatoriales cyanobacterium]TAF01109.1 MAG: hypothetical protein EAZ79_00765 [Oscillatoriales cyanobacterium]TAF13014.1 MAG: hypothetical protein EAZ73_30835 [Oscillatoriales cyanobacterium]TAF26329.1 MAG: hypothetical protein EAZ69_29195 [Oscillatoriales cyanobacterium]TAF57240.1 MAG: hypothetical protein EAZ60_07600 [Oscillatoriales cyanobacterium]
MTQESSPQKLVETLLQSIDPSAIADESLRRTVSILLNLIEQLQAETREFGVRESKIKTRKQSP